MSQLVAAPVQTNNSVAVEGVSHSFYHLDGSEVPVLETTDLQTKPGEFVCLVGPSGCGKTTVLNMVAGLIQAQSGRVTVAGGPAREGNTDVGYLLARDTLLPWRTALKNVTLPLELRGVSRREAEARAKELLEEVGLDQFLDSYPGQLSHGMRQRVALSRTLVGGPSTLLMDEPFSALDAETRLKLQGVFLKLWEVHQSTVLFVTHDLAEAITLGDRILVFSARPGKILAEFHIELPRPRNVLELQGNAQYHKYFQDIWAVFREELS